MHLIRFIFGIFITVTLASTGVALIAQESKPGDLLFTFKTNVNEKLAGSLMRSYTAALDHEVDLLEERLTEIDELVTDGEMNPETAVLAKAAVVKQLEKTSAAFAEADAQGLSPEAKERLAASLLRVQLALKEYQSAVDAVDDTLPAPALTDEVIDSSIADAFSDAAETITELTTNVLDADNNEEVIVTEPDLQTATSTSATSTSTGSVYPVLPEDSNELPVEPNPDLDVQTSTGTPTAIDEEVTTNHSGTSVLN